MARAMRDIGGLITLPSDVEGMIFDVDGVLIDSVSADHDLCVSAAQSILNDGAWLKRSSILKHFALEPESFWAELIKDAPYEVSPTQLDALIENYDARRADTVFETIAGAVNVLQACLKAGLKCAVASSNDETVLIEMLKNAGLAEHFEVICGIAGPETAPKPAPDIYRNAAAGLGLDPGKCAFIEDSLTGLKAGRAAGIDYAIAVATGPAAFNDLADSGLADLIYDRFAENSVAFFDGAPMNKSIDTPNDFVSHMVEHIAWRLGTGVSLRWRNGDWRALGQMLGAALKRFDFEPASAATLGMIDDGAAETLIDFTQSPGVDFDTHHSLNRAAILKMRAEQVRSGQELVDLMAGIADGLGAHITVRLCTFEDPHHSWEGVYRAIGICLSRLRRAA